MIVYCSQCGKEFESKEKSCPRCRSNDRTLQINEEIKVALGRSWVRSKAIVGHEKRPFYEVVFEDSFCNNRGKFVDRKMVFDRTNDHYQEIVQDKQSGEIIHESNVKLSEKFRRQNKQKK